MKSLRLLLVLVASFSVPCCDDDSDESSSPAATTEEKLDSSDADTRREGLREAEEKYK